MKALIGERIVLREFRPQDVDDVFAYASDPEVAQHMEWAPHRDLSATEAYLQICMDAYARRVWYPLAGERREFQRLSGSPVTESSNHHQFVVEKRVADDLEFFGRVEHDVEIVLIAAHARDKAIPVSDFHGDVDLRKAPTEIPQHAWQEVSGSTHQRHP